MPSSAWPTYLCSPHEKSLMACNSGDADDPRHAVPTIAGHLIANSFPPEHSRKRSRLLLPGILGEVTGLPPRTSDDHSCRVSIQHNLPSVAHRSLSFGKGRLWSADYCAPATPSRSVHSSWRRRRSALPRNRVWRSAHICSFENCPGTGCARRRAPMRSIGRSRVTSPPRYPTQPMPRELQTDDDRNYAHLLTLLSVSAALVGVCLAVCLLAAPTARAADRPHRPRRFPARCQKGRRDC